MNASGSIQKKNGYWYCVINMNDEHGKRRQKWIATGLKIDGNKRRAEAILREHLNKCNSGIVYSRNILFTDWVNKWLEHKELEVSPTTLHGYRGYADKHIIPFYAERGTILQDMRPMDIQSYYDEKIRAGLSTATVTRHKEVIFGALKYAYQQELIPNNPADRATVPKVPAVSRAHPCTLEQVQELLQAAKESPIYPAVFLALSLGLRREEILGLEWKAIDFENRRIHIYKTVTRLKELVIREIPKTKSSLRDLAMTEDVAKFLHDLKIQQALQKLAMGEPYIVSDWVCTHKDGRLMQPDYISTTFHNLCKKCGISGVRFHDLRHTVGSLLYDSGTPLKDIQDLLGHSTLSTTANIYVHPSDASKEKTAAAMSSILKIPS